MSDKKNEDYSVRMPDSPREKDPFVFAGQRSPPHSHRQQHPSTASVSRPENSPPLSIVAYCLSSISMTIVNKYVVSGSEWNLNFFYLAVQATVCIVTIVLCKQVGLIRNMSPFDSNKAKKWFPISLLLVGMIYTGTKTLQFLLVPVYTIFKNLTIIVIAYGEVLCSVVAAWADIQNDIHGGFGESADASAAISALNAGYAWMGLNVFCSASYTLGQKEVVKKLNFKDRDRRNAIVIRQPCSTNLLSIPVLIICSPVAEAWSADNIHKNFPGLIFFVAPVTFGSVSAIALALVSGIIYARARIRQAAAAKISLPTVQPAVSVSSQSIRDANS
ncbi:hypothetical protein QBC33DRAFT_599766 [Phialemonium atrogriseum]|uniref:GMT n=1 Tax=Phialemonium atrogriseum TaxID=1093897 RepID=A0AAJ0BQZ0_9PEZI|nr:uncharacterized protein QBC33DRAFT_599766 [Phialemonium atrogriseum]KAK1762860.1 hypothetical protein QBC33DRAFT_599766 [Phialemonium atrogriseum]